MAYPNLLTKIQPYPLAKVTFHRELSGNASLAKQAFMIDVDFLQKKIATRSEDTEDVDGVGRSFTKPPVVRTTGLLCVPELLILSACLLFVCRVRLSTENSLLKVRRTDIFGSSSLGFFSRCDRSREASSVQSDFFCARCQRKPYVSTES